MSGDQGKTVSGDGGSEGVHKPDTFATIANEFAEVAVRRVLTHNGARLEIRSARLGRSIRLDALQLESLTWQKPGLFSDLLVDPFGPSPITSSDTSSHRETPPEIRTNGRAR